MMGRICKFWIPLLHSAPFAGMSGRTEAKGRGRSRSIRNLGRLTLAAWDLRALGGFT